MNLDEYVDGLAKEALKPGAEREPEPLESVLKGQAVELYLRGDDRLFIVADGMGGYKAGEVASKLAVQKISEALKSFLVPISEQPTIKLTPVSDLQTVKLDPVKPGEESAKQHKTRKLSETPTIKNIEDQLKAE